MPNPTLSLVHVARPPRRPDPTGRPPVLLFLHGYGSNEHDLLPIADYLDPRFFVVSARAPRTLGPGMFAWFGLEMSPTGGVVVREDEVADARRELLRFLGELTEAYPVDAARVYPVGFSQGAIMAAGVALTEPERVAGAVLMSGSISDRIGPHLAAPERLDGLPLLVVHGVHDDVLPIHHGRAARDLLGRLPVKLTYREYPIGHWTSPESIGDIAGWLTARLDEGTAGRRAG